MSGDFVDSLFISHIGNLTNVINHLTFRERPHTTEYLKKTHWIPAVLLYLLENQLNTCTNLSTTGNMMKCY